MGCFTMYRFRWAMKKYTNKEALCVQFLDYSDDEEERRARSRTRGRDVSAEDERTEDGTDDTMSQQGRKRRKKKKMG